jgi:hypothetical protein
MARCTNCGSKLLRGATSCPDCGVFAGEEVDGRPVPKRSHKPFWITIAFLAALAAAYAVWRFVPPQKPQTVRETPVRVVKDRPGVTRRASGAAVNEAEATRLLRRHLIERQQMKNECIAILSRGSRGGHYVFTAVDSCTRTRLGQWRVDAKTGDVRR